MRPGSTGEHHLAGHPLTSAKSFFQFWLDLVIFALFHFQSSHRISNRNALRVQLIVSTMTDTCCQSAVRQVFVIYLSCEVIHRQVFSNHLFVCCYFGFLFFICFSFCTLAATQFIGGSISHSLRMKEPCRRFANLVARSGPSACHPGCLVMSPSRCPVSCRWLSGGFYSLWLFHLLSSKEHKPGNEPSYPEKWAEGTPGHHQDELLPGTGYVSCSLF